MAAQDNTFFVRNWRPNRVVFKYSGLKYVLERRGDRQDTTALPLDAKSDPTIARWLKMNILEDIEKDEFIELAARTSDGPFAPLRSKAKEVDIPIENRTSAEPTTIKSELIDNQEWRKKHLSPSLEYMTEPESTSEEVARKRAEAELKSVEEVASKKTKSKA